MASDKLCENGHGSSAPRVESLEIIPVHMRKLTLKAYEKVLF